METIWEIENHTLAKHAILKRYLQAWFPIMAKTFESEGLNYIDGFAGPGVYQDGEKGSPVIALETAMGLNKNLACKIAFTFIESDKARCENLKSVLSSISVPDIFEYEVINSKFDEELNQVLEDLKSRNEGLAPCFAFVDPFGISDTPFSIIERIMSFPSCEVLITFMSRDINRFKDLTFNREHINKLLGTDRWDSTMFAGGEKSIVDFYQKRLNGITQFVRSFEMKGRSNQTIYRLIFATNNYKGLMRMKEAMWKADETGNFTYSDTTNPNQTVLFKQEPNYNELKKLIVDNFEGKKATIDEIEKFVVIKTPYRETHFKTQILAPMEKADPPEIVIEKCKPDRIKGYKDKNMIIRFISRSELNLQAMEKSKSRKHSQSTLF